MNRYSKRIAILGLILTIMPPLLLFLNAGLNIAATKHIMLTGMLLWFAGAIPWLAFRKEELDTSTQDQI